MCGDLINPAYTENFTSREVNLSIPSRGPEDAGYSIYFMPTDNVEMPPEFTFIFHNATTDGFIEREWLIFFQWYEQHLPAVFPDATLVVSRHPADGTKTEELMNVSKSTGIPLPKADRIRYEKWLAANN